MLSKKYTIIILGGLLRKNPNGSFKTGRFNYVRVLAGYYLYKKLSEKNKVVLIVSGGKGIYKDIPGVPPVAKVMKSELVKLGLSQKEILEENKTPSTYAELVWIKNFLTKNSNKVILVSNSYHLPRIKTMMNYLSEFKGLGKNILLTSAEKVVIKFNNKLENKINRELKSLKMKSIIANEQRGIRALKSGNYKIRTWLI
ncbi:MAG: hypothetical protein A3B86_02710 [Candidatus Yanofskybacteria bacterium RIFCSPHIGHO2_02_FULL_38_22b]|uniref:DUF218 domain-containing protein n=1 Tax=Candidatus Yanofskybacteria bacterium RIFCSPHIGHO2_02_FULL_38_22b TaxID=1802673 RepID=A0A1F8F3Q1_9BACT|nr:MAG: hypothetical protein A2816_03145 [Candidatus Yanofskybacteria bacterium RIFCSPHIGHO2_01_FULL_39_44]OGN07767.1 MAG: hypothetical protein A3B86_02710 [Candidatus Yanofskybacteria bacterium RIFCSPHIGHO2_02_FULL_38_22b]OGN20649.1 MAG: hypothetical protein A2910_02545 [Candidatus Yanofskybacteria bacterium RIFCSPLOWO2_01_FULL_39_28]